REVEGDVDAAAGGDARLDLVERVAQSCRILGQRRARGGEQAPDLPQVVLGRVGVGVDAGEDGVEAGAQVLDHVTPPAGSTGWPRACGGRAGAWSRRGRRGSRARGPAPCTIFPPAPSSPTPPP